MADGARFLIQQAIFHKLTNAFTSYLNILIKPKMTTLKGKNH